MDTPYRCTLLYLLLSCTLLSACSIVKVLSILNGGQVDQTTFAGTIDFERRLGLLIVPVYIEGEHYDFLVDSGAPTVLSTELAAKLQLPVLAEQEVADSQQARDGMTFSRVPSITVGGVDFQDIGVAVTDLNASTDITCLEIDGLLGANLLRRADWRFNYAAGTIEFANSLAALDRTADWLEVPLSFTLTKTPVMTVRLGDNVKAKRVAVDLGSNGGISLAPETLQALSEELQLPAARVWYGIGGGGVYGREAVDSTLTVRMPNVSFGDVELDSVSISFEDEEMSTVGSGFFEDYDVVISWRKRKMWLTPTGTTSHDPSADYGVSFGYANGQLVVRKLRRGSEAARLLQVGDHVVKWAGQSYDLLSQEGYCAFINREGPQKDSVAIEVERAGERIAAVLADTH